MTDQPTPTTHGGTFINGELASQTTEQPPAIDPKITARRAQRAAERDDISPSFAPTDEEE